MSFGVGWFFLFVFCFLICWCKVTISVHLILVLLLVGVLSPFLFSWNYEWSKIHLVDVQPGIWWYICHLPKYDFTGYFLHVSMILLVIFCMCKFRTSCMEFLEKYFQFYCNLYGTSLWLQTVSTSLFCHYCCDLSLSLLSLESSIFCLVNTAVRCLLPVFCFVTAGVTCLLPKSSSIFFSTSIKWPTSSFWKLSL